MISDHLTSVRQRITSACQRSGRDPSSVTLVCVTKGVAQGRLEEAIALGVRELGENRVQEAEAKRAVLGAQPVRWHLIGHLQRNKAKLAARLFDTIHSVDSRPLIEVLGRECAARRTPLDVLVQVNVSGEATKFGCRPEEVLALAQRVTQHAHLKLKGLMTLAPFSDHPEDARPYFRRLRLVRDELAVALNLPSSALSLSMGMSRDFEIAIEEGAGFVRIGTAIFGERD